MWLECQQLCYHKHDGSEFGIELRIQKTKRTQLSLLTKKEIIRYYKMHVKATQQGVAEFFNKKYGFEIKRSIIMLGFYSARTDKLEIAMLVLVAKQI